LEFGSFQRKTEIFSMGNHGISKIVKEFPKFNIAPVKLEYDEKRAPCRHIYTNIPVAYRELVNKRLNEMLQAGIIEEVTSEMRNDFCSSLIVVPKGKDDIRLVVDLRGPNSYIVRTAFNMPTQEDILKDLHGAQFFTTIDLVSVFFSRRAGGREPTSH
jgi:hypothetical protein